MMRHRPYKEVGRSVKTGGTRLPCGNASTQRVNNFAGPTELNHSGPTADNQ